MLGHVHVKPVELHALVMTAAVVVSSQLQNGWEANLAQLRESALASETSKTDIQLVCNCNNKGKFYTNSIEQQCVCKGLAQLEVWNADDSRARNESKPE